MMDSWTDALQQALSTGDTASMRQALERVPAGVLQQAVPLLRELAGVRGRSGDHAAAVDVCAQVLLIEPGDLGTRVSRARSLMALQRFAEAQADAREATRRHPESADAWAVLADACEALGERAETLTALARLQSLRPADRDLAARIQACSDTATVGPAAEAESTEDAARPALAVDAASLADPRIPPELPQAMVEGLRRHLQRYSQLQAHRLDLEMLEDAEWRRAWDTVLSGLAGRRVVLHGSGMGLLALRALHHGARTVGCDEASAWAARITSGVIQKNLLAQWHARFGEGARDWSSEQKQASFSEFGANIEVFDADADVDTAATSSCDVIALTRFDHSLLGTGVVSRLARLRERNGDAAVQVLPARAQIYAQAIQWRRDAAGFDLQALDMLRWSFHPQPFDLPADAWTPMSDVHCVADIDFTRFQPQRHTLHWPARAAGPVHAVIYWYTLDFGGVQISTAVGSGLSAIKPAMQHLDPLHVSAPGTLLNLELEIHATRMFFRACDAVPLPRTRRLPGWYIPMLLDAQRNRAYAEALAAAAERAPVELALDIGAGCGLLSMMAARAGVSRVVGCEWQPAIRDAGARAVLANGLTGSVTLVTRDCRKLEIPGQLPRKADLALFELFDCSLIGEGVLHFLADARERLLVDGARLIPAHARLRAQIIEWRLDRYWDLDASLLNPYRYSPAFINVDTDRMHYRALSAPVDLFEFDFRTATPTADRRELTPSAQVQGTAGAVLFWFDLSLDEHRQLSNAPGSTLHWKQGLQFLPEVRVERGDSLPFLAQHDGAGLRFAWQREALEMKAPSTLPRFDPRWMAASSDLERQTQTLMQHCEGNPEEWRRVATLAQCFASDPAAHGLDPAIAQRFAAMFFGG